MKSRDFFLWLKWVFVWGERVLTCQLMLMIVTEGFVRYKLMGFYMKVSSPPNNRPANKGIMRDPHTYRIHVWYIYLHFPYKSTIHVGKYTSPMHPMGYYKCNNPVGKSCHLLSVSIPSCYLSYLTVELCCHCMPNWPVSIWGGVYRFFAGNEDCKHENLSRIQ